jgi:hypothetical protein
MRTHLNGVFLEFSSYPSFLSYFILFFSPVFSIPRFCNSFRLICKRVNARVEARLIIMTTEKGCVCRVYCLRLVISIETAWSRGEDNIRWSIWTRDLRLPLYSVFPPIFIERVSYLYFMYSELILGWTVRGSNPGVSKRYLCSPKCPEDLWSSHILLFNEYGGSYPSLNWPES